MLKYLTVGAVAVIGVMADTNAVREDEGVKLFAHSFDAPLDLDEIAEWRSLGASVGTRDSYIVVPAVPARTGTFWHQKKLDTDDFVLAFKVKAEGSGKKDNKGNTFSVWFTGELQTPEAFELGGMDRFVNGFGIVFEGRDQVKLYMGDGVRDIRGDSAKGTFQWLDKGDIDVKIRASPLDGIHVFAKRSNKRTWTPVLQSRTGPQHEAIRAKDGFSGDLLRLYPTDGYVQFAGVSAPENNEAALIMVTELEVTNMNPLRGITAETQASNEEVAALLKQAALEEADALFKEEHGQNFDEERVLVVVTQLLEKHAEDVDSRVREQTRDVRRIIQELRDLRLTVKILKAKLAAVKTSTGGFAAAGSEGAVIGELKSQIARLQEEALKQQREYADNIEQLTAEVEQRQKDMAQDQQKQLERLAKRSRTLSESMDEQGTFFMIVFLLAAAAVAGMAGMAYRKMKQLEKKHYL